MRQIIVCLLIVAGATVTGLSQIAPPKELPATITGKVTVQGNAVSGVVITLLSTDRNSYRKLMDQRGVTNANGEYRIADVPPGPYLVAPNTTSFIVASGDIERSVLLSKGETIQDFDFSLLPGGVITGKVVDPDGRPVIEEEVRWYPEGEQGMASRLSLTTTDDRGVYRIFGLKPGAYKVSAGRGGDTGGARPSGYHARTFYPGVSERAEAAVIKVNEGTEATNIDITLSRMLTTYTAFGRVVDGATGQPVKDVNIGYKRSGPDRINRGNLGGTNEQGEFKLEDLVPGHYVIVAQSRPGSFFRVEEVQFEIINQDVTGLVVKTVEDASLSGIMVLDSTNDKEAIEQLGKVRLVAFLETEESRKTGTSGVAAEVQPNGSFRIGGLPAGTASFIISGPPVFHIIRVERNGILQTRGFEVKKAERVTGLRIVVGRANASLRGVIEVENGALPPNARFYVSARRLNVEYAGINPTAEIDERGHFRFDAMVPGVHEISAGVVVPGSPPRIYKRQQVVVIAGTTSTMTIKMDLNPPKPKQ